MESFSNSYKAAGVDITAGYKTVELIKEHVNRTKISGVLSDIGGFGGLFELDLKKYTNPVLVSSTDGVGTKLKIAFKLDKHDTIGIDCVAMCVNDIICSGAKPLFFLDYIAIGKNQPEKVASIVSGVSDGCMQAGCALIGGETAEMPGFYDSDEYDIAGFAVGLVEKSKIIDSSKITPGDVIIGLVSSGLHSNGYSLVRKAIDIKDSVLSLYVDDLGCTVGEELIKPTKIYVKPVLSAIESFNIKGIAHITGGGFYENIPRMLPDNTKAVIEKSSYPLPAIFRLIQSTGNIPERDMYNTFNMGIGMCLVVSREEADAVVKIIEKHDQKAYIIGEITQGEGGIELC